MYFTDQTVVLKMLKIPKSEGQQDFYDHDLPIYARFVMYNHVHNCLGKTEIRAELGNFRLDLKAQIWFGNMSGTEIRNPRNRLGTRLEGMIGFNDFARRPKILSLNLKYD